MTTAQQTLSLTPPQLVNIFTVLNLLIMFLILFFRKSNTYPNRILAVILILPGVTFIGNIFFQGQELYRFPIFIYISQIASLLGAPLIDHYFSVFIGRKQLSSKILHILSAMAIGLAFLYLCRYFILPDVRKVKLIKGVVEQNFPAHLQWLRATFFILMNAYFINKGDIPYGISALEFRYHITTGYSIIRKLILHKPLPFTRHFCGYLKQVGAG